MPLEARKTTLAALATLVALPLVIAAALAAGAFAIGLGGARVARRGGGWMMALGHSSGPRSPAAESRIPVRDVAGA